MLQIESIENNAKIILKNLKEIIYTKIYFER